MEKKEPKVETNEEPASQESGEEAVMTPAAAQADTLKQASQTGAPFCEVCGDTPPEAEEEELDEIQAEAEDPEDEDETVAAEEAGEEDSADSKKTWLYVITPLDENPGKFFLHEIEGIEQISGLFHYKLILKTDDNTIDFSQILGEEITVVIEQYNGTKRYINGVVFRFIQAGYDGKITTYYAEIRPWLWHLTLTSNSRIFQNQTVPEIIADVFADLGFTDFDDRTSSTYNQRVYCTQYQETAFAFISRLMEDEGIFYFFEHTQDTHTLVIADDADAHQACPGLETARLRQVLQDQQATDELIDRCSFEQQLIPNKYGVEDYNFETPDTDLLTGVDGKLEGNLRIYEYPGGFTSTDSGETIANKRIESFELPQKLMKGQGFCRGFIAGYKFDLQNHEREDMNRSYVLRSLSVWANQDRYTNTFQTFPAGTPFRPLQVTPKPRIFGTQTALVVGKSGEEIWTDQYGRVKVQFHWDQEGKKDENSSCWVRVAQVWAGKNWGTLFIPRIGTEVIISFLDGDPDKPVIIGTVYNATQTVPYSLPENKNKSTIKTMSTKQGSAGNEIRFDDTKDSEELYIHAQKDMVTEVENDQTVTVTKNRSVTVKEENDSLTVEKGERTVKISKGNETHTNAADYTQKVKGNFVLEVQGNITLKATGEVTIKGAMVKIN